MSEVKKAEKGKLTNLSESRSRRISGERGLDEPGDDDDAVFTSSRAAIRMEISCRAVWTENKVSYDKRLKKKPN
jgi:hypothetical protein